MVKEQYRDTDGSRIMYVQFLKYLNLIFKSTYNYTCVCRSKISFTVDSPQDIQRKSHICINTRNLYAINNNSASRTPHPYGVLDHKLV